MTLWLYDSPAASAPVRVTVASTTSSALPMMVSCDNTIRSSQPAPVAAAPVLRTVQLTTASVPDSTLAGAVSAVTDRSA